MKKTITVTMVLLFATIFTNSFGRSSAGITTVGGPDHITTLVINASVTVVLVDDEQSKPEIFGKSVLFDLVTFTQKGDTLVIGSLKKRYLVGAGTIYIPAAWLKNIRINSDATVRSLRTLQIPKLNVVINGSCFVEVANIGELNLSGTEAYSFEQSRTVRPIPLNLLKNKKS